MNKFLPSSIEGKERIVAIDVVRGFAIMGILLVNGPTLNGPAIMDTLDFAFQKSTADIWYTKFIFSFALDRFYPIFALLFGISAAIFMSTKKNDYVFKLWLRRIFYLMLIGSCHAALVWWGDILIVYSLLGFSLILFYKISKEKVFRFFLILLAICLSLTMLLLIFPDTKQLLIPLNEDLIYQNGNFFEITQKRIFDFYGVYIPGVFYKLDMGQIINFTIYFLQLFLLFVFGFYLFVSGILSKITKDRNFTFKIVLFTFLFSFLCWVLSISLKNIGELFYLWQGILQGFFYASFLIYCCEQKYLKTFFRFFSYVGQMSLSNYLLHNIILSFLFYGYGIGLYGLIGPFKQFFILIGMMIFSLVFSSLWLKYYKFGPIEWLWRAATYGKFSKLRKKNPSDNSADFVFGEK